MIGQFMQNIALSHATSDARHARCPRLSGLCRSSGWVMQQNAMEVVGWCCNQDSSASRAYLMGSAAWPTGPGAAVQGHRPPLAG